MKVSASLASVLLFALVSIISGPALSQESGADDRATIAGHMHEYLGRLTEVKSHVVMGNLEAIREPGNWLAEHKIESGEPGALEPYVVIMRENARAVAGSQDLQSAAIAVSSMARTCGNCHLASDVDLAFGYDSVPDDWSDTISHMQRHQWAVDRLWDGLIGPSDVAWNRGSDMLVDVPLNPNDVAGETISEADLVALDKITDRIHSLGSRGIDAKTQDERSALYGEVLGLCAQCHTKLGRGPGG